MATSTDPAGLVEIVTGTVVAPMQVAIPAVAATLLIGALTGSDDTHVTLCGLGTILGTPHVVGVSTQPTLKAT
jgi:hypothetical protein